MSDESPMNDTQARLVPAASARVRPLYEPARLVKWAVFEAGELQRKADKARASVARQQEAVERDREAVRRLNERSDAVMAEAREKADAVVADARAEAERIVAAAHADADAVREQHKADGLKTGHAEGRAAFDRLLATLPDQRAELEEAFAEEAGRAAFSLARVILDVEFRHRPEHVAEHVRQVIREVGPQDRIVVRLHPDDLRLVEQSDATEHQLVDDILLAADPGVERGGCRVETPAGNYDGTVAAQLEQLRQRLQIGGDA